MSIVAVLGQMDHSNIQMAQGNAQRCNHIKSATAVEWKHQSYLPVKTPLLTYEPIEHAYALIPHI